MPARRPSSRQPDVPQVLVVATVLVAVATALVAGATVLSVVPVTTAQAAPPPVEVCGVCGDQLSTVGPREGVPMNVEYSVANVSVREDGSAHWHARVWITGSAADRFAANATLREHVVRTTLEDDRTAVDDPRNLRTRVAGSTLVVDFDVRDVAHRSVGGVSLVDFLTRRYHGRSLQVDADTLRVRGPNGTVVVRAPEGARVRNDSAVWRPAGRNYALDGRGRLAFAGSDGPVAAFAATLAVTTDDVGVGGPGVLLAGAVPALVLLGSVWVFRSDRVGLPSPDSTILAQGLAALAAGIAGLAALSIFLSAAFGGTAVIGTPLAAVIATCCGLYALVAAGPLAMNDPSVGRTVAWTLGAGVLVALAAGVVSADAFRAALYGFTVALFLPLGRAHGLATARPDRRSRTRTGLLVATIALAPLALAVTVLPLDGWLSGAVLTIVVLLPWAFASALFGLPLYLIGRGLDDGE